MRMLTLATGLTCALLAGCVSHQRISLSELSAEEIPDFAKELDLIVAAQIPRDRDQVIEHFGRDLLGEHVLPVSVYLQNLSQADSFRVSVAGITFELIDGRALDRISPESVSEQFRYSQWRSVFPYFFGVLPGVVVSENVKEKNREMLEDFRSHSLEDTPLHARAPKAFQGTRGVLFFEIPPDVTLKDLRKGSLNLSVTRMREDGKENEFPMTIVFQER